MLSLRRLKSLRKLSTDDIQAVAAIYAEQVRSMLTVSLAVSHFLPRDRDTGMSCARVLRQGVCGIDNLLSNCSTQHPLSQLRVL